MAESISANGSVPTMDSGYIEYRGETASQGGTFGDGQAYPYVITTSIRYGWNCHFTAEETVGGVFNWFEVPFTYTTTNGYYIFTVNVPSACKVHYVITGYTMDPTDAELGAVGEGTSMTWGGLHTHDGKNSPTLTADDIPGLPAKTYVAKIAQTGTNDPVLTIMTNTTGTTITAGRADVGQYTLTAGASIFTSDKTAVFITTGNATGAFITTQRTGPTTIGISTFDATGAPADGRLTNGSIKIEIYS